jgi:hypothetical protein
LKTDRKSTDPGYAYFSAYGLKPRAVLLNHFMVSINRRIHPMIKPEKSTLAPASE